jgi:hypothetical protein
MLLLKKREEKKVGIGAWHVTQVSKEFYFDQITRLSNVKQAWLHIYKNFNFVV